MSKRLGFISVIVSVFLLAGCGAEKETAPSNEGKTETEAQTSAQTAADNGLSDKEITVIVKNLTGPFFISVSEGAKAAGEELGVKVNVLAPVGQEGAGNEEQAQMVEQAIAQQVDALVICPVDSKGIVPAVKKVVDAGIPVVNLNTKIGGTEQLAKTFVAIENYEVGKSVAQNLCEKMGGDGKLIIIEGTAGAQTSIDRVQGANDAIKEYPDIEVVASQSANYSRADAMNVAQNLLQSNPDVEAIFCCNDEMAMGVVEAIDAAGKTGSILVTGVDANADARQAIKDGKMYATCDSQPYYQGYDSVMAAAKILRGEPVEDFYRTETKLITIENVDE